MRLLIIEDSERLQLALRTGLEGAGHVVDGVSDGKKGWEYASRNDYDVIMLDLMLPEIDGLTILRRLRAEGHQSHILILTAKGAVEDRVEGLRAGADDYLTKPFEFVELLARIEALGRRRYGAKSPVLDFDGLVIDTAYRRITWLSQEVQLSKREFSLLHYLALRHGQVVTRIEIEDHLYNEHTLPSSNAVDSSICTLRRKLNDAGCTEMIHTKRGAGYMMQRLES